jgi:hypothetical protein
MENYGTVDMSISFIDNLKKRVMQSIAAQKVIPFPLLFRLGADNAVIVNRLRSVNLGIIPQTFILFPLIPNIPLSSTISKLRVTFDLKNVRFSVRSTRKNRILVLASYSSVPILPAPSGPMEPKAA